MSIKSSVAALAMETVTSSPLTRRLLRPFLAMVLVIMSGSSQAMPMPWSIRCALASGTCERSKTARTLASSAPLRTYSVRARSPRTTLRASMIMDLPAPVSPVNTLSPGPGVMRSLSMRAKSSTESSRSTHLPSPIVSMAIAETKEGYETYLIPQPLPLYSPPQQELCRRRLQNPGSHPREASLWRHQQPGLCRVVF